MERSISILCPPRRLKKDLALSELQHALHHAGGVKKNKNFSYNSPEHCCLLDFLCFPLKLWQKYLKTVFLWYCTWENKLYYFNFFLTFNICCLQMLEPSEKGFLNTQANSPWNPVTPAAPLAELWLMSGLTWEFPLPWEDSRLRPPANTLPSTTKRSKAFCLNKTINVLFLLQTGKKIQKHAVNI